MALEPKLTMDGAREEATLVISACLDEVAKNIRTVNFSFNSFFPRLVSSPKM
jgi:hypothetical protein